MNISIITSCYQGITYLEGYFHSIQAQSLFDQVEIVFIHNEPSEAELALVAEFKAKNPGKLNHLIVNPVEPLGASWNRGWMAAKGKYLAVANLDDRRTPNSLEAQYKALEGSTDGVLAYGDFIRVPEYGMERGQYIHTPKFSKKTFSRAFPMAGAFFMWRKDLAEKVGYFDEQLKVGIDTDFIIRTALNDQKMCRTDTLLGYFLFARKGLSTRENSLGSTIDRTAIQLRYGIYDRVRPEYSDQAKAYDLDHVLQFGEWQPVVKYLPNGEGFYKNKAVLWKIGKIRNTLRAAFRRLGLLDLIYQVQQRLIRRDI
ncbi:MAG: glycosyltransferase [Anaerolineae bacterium]|nr:glycosyltransferase [Anaerolineae bacterium]